MRRFLPIAFMLLAVPAFAQPESNRVGKASVAPQVQDRAQAELRQQARPAQQQQDGGRRDRGDNRNRVAAPAQQSAPQSATRDNRGDRGSWNNRVDNRRENNRRTGEARPEQRQDFNRDGRTGYRPDIRRGASYGGPRHDFSGFRDYHRTFRASRRFRSDFYRRPAGWYEHRWSYGEFLPAAYWARDYWLVDFEEYDLQPPPYGAIWVRVGTDALMIDEDSGEVITVAYDVFY